MYQTIRKKTFGLELVCIYIQNLFDGRSSKNAMLSTITSALGSRWHRNMVIGTAVSTVAVWLSLNAVSMNSFPSLSVKVVATLFGLTGVIISFLVKHKDMRYKGEVYGTIASVACVIMLFMWLESPTSETTLSLSIFTMGLVMISYFEIMMSVRNISRINHRD